MAPITEKEFNLITKDTIKSIPFKMFQNRKQFKRV